LIALLWALRCISEKRLIFKKTPLNVVIIVFLVSQLVSTLFSIDIRSSIFGYYDRFNGGLLSLTAYAVLYLGYVSNMSKRQTALSLKTILLSTTISSVYGISEHFGVDKNLWVQDVQNRVFSTFGQPNWLAAWLAAVIPVGLFFSLKTFENKHEEESGKQKFRFQKTIPYIFTSLAFLTLLFTKSRSGILGFAFADIIFWILILKHVFKDKPRRVTTLKLFIVNHLIFLFVTIFVGTPWTPNISKLFRTNSLNNTEAESAVNEAAVTPALETGGSSSAEIRRIVWQGALDVWKNYPLFGSGVETFAFSYYKYRPASHNLVSEWDFLYNKAHNEYLNFMATTGTVGILAYLLLIVLSLAQISGFKLITSKPNLKNDNQQDKNEQHNALEIRNLNYALLAGYASILITNFFGFSVVPISLLFFIFPAFALSEQGSDRVEEYRFDFRKFNSLQKLAGIILASFTLFLIYSVFRYWYADILYNRAHLFYKSGRLIDAVNTIGSAIKLSPHEAIYQNELASNFAEVALVYNKQDSKDNAKKFAGNAKKIVLQAESLSPSNLNILRNHARIAINLSEIDPDQILDAKNTLLKALDLAPTDAKLYLNLSMVYYRINDTDKAIELLEKTIELKTNYRDARYAYAVILSEKGEIEGAKAQLKYILDTIDPNDENALKELKNLDSTAN